MKISRQKIVVYCIMLFLKSKKVTSTVHKYGKKTSRYYLLVDEKTTHVMRTYVMLFQKFYMLQTIFFFLISDITLNLYSTFYHNKDA